MCIRDRLIDELMFYSKIDTNKIPYVFSKINVASYFGDCAEEVGLDMESRNIDLGYFNYVDEDVVVIADAEQLKRVINNIISNSVKYIDKKRGIINIRIRDDGDFIQAVSYTHLDVYKRQEQDTHQGHMYGGVWRGGECRPSSARIGEGAIIQRLRNLLTIRGFKLQERKIPSQRSGRRRGDLNVT